MDDSSYSEFKSIGEKRKNRVNSKRCLVCSYNSTDKNMFHLLLLLFNAKFYKLWTKELQKLLANLKHVIRFFSRDVRY